MSKVILSAPLTTVLDAVGGNKLGDVYIDDAGAKYIFCKGIASTIAGSAVAIDTADFTTVLLTKAEADKLKPVAFAVAATVANKYGWYRLEGKGDIAVKASCAKEVPLYTSATAGYLDDDGTSQTKITGAVLNTTRVASDGVASAFVADPRAV